MITEDFNCEIDSDLVDGVIVKEVFSAGWQTSASGLRIVASSLHLPVINLFFFGTVGKTVPLEQQHIAKHVKIPEPVNGWLRANQNESNVKKAKAPRPNFGETSAKQSLIKEDCVVVCDPPEGFTKDRRESSYTSIFGFVSFFFFFLFNLV